MTLIKVLILVMCLAIFPTNQSQDRDSEHLSPYSRRVTHNDSSTPIAKTATRWRALLDVIKCVDVDLQFKLRMRGNFRVLHNFVIANKSYGCRESVTITTPGDYRFLDNVPPLVDRWRGPISIALYAPGHDFYTTLKSIAYLRNCKSLVKEYVTFHLFFETDHEPKVEERQSITAAYEDSFNCSLKPPYEELKDDDMYKVQRNLTYPINVARNVARMSAQTHFVFPTDIELYPTRNFIPKFLRFINDNPDYAAKGAKNVFVLPIFEILADQSVPENKTQLQVMLKQNKAFLFHKNVCSPCHKVTNGDSWVKTEETEGLGVSAVGKREGPQVIWEPFYVSTQNEPEWDDILDWEGQGNKMSQAFHMCMLNYDFMVLNNAFLIHKPGVKKKKVQVLKHMDETRKNNAILRRIQRELKLLYGNNRKCKIHYV